MNILKELAEASQKAKHHAPKKQTSYMPKTRLPTQSKTTTRKCSQCTKNDARKYHISEKEVRWLCPIHFTLFTKIDDEKKPHFVKASKLDL